MDPIVSVQWLRERLGEPGIVVVDCRFKLGAPGAGRALWRAERIPGAGFLDVDRDLSGTPGRRGRHPLPDALDFQAAARRAGIGADSTVVACDEAGEGGAARLWWLLRHYGQKRAALLDGGLAAWRAAGAPLERGDPDRGSEPPPLGDFTAHERAGDTASIAELRERGDAIVLLDARAPARYRGDEEPIDPVAGHIPGARNLPFADVVPGGRFAPRDELRARLAAAGVEDDADVVAYCGSGITASLLVAAAEAAGRPGVRLYPGSWSEWCQTIHPPERND